MIQHHTCEGLASNKCVWGHSHQAGKGSLTLGLQTRGGGRRVEWMCESRVRGLRE